MQDGEFGLMSESSEFVDQIKSFLFAGHDTTAAMLAWSYYYLAQYPECLARLRAELDAIFGSGADPAHIAKEISSDPKILGKLEYTTAVMKEALRLRPIGDGLRYASRGYIIRTATGMEFDVTDTILDIQHLSLHTDPNIWGLSANEFEPDRFMHGKPIPYAYMPFAKRPRDCIGRNLAYLEVTASLTRLC